MHVLTACTGGGGAAEVEPVPQKIFLKRNNFRILQPRPYFPICQRQLETKSLEIGPEFTAVN